jgi:hypothetical protein
MSDPTGKNDSPEHTWAVSHIITVSNQDRNPENNNGSEKNINNRP